MSQLQTAFYNQASLAAQAAYIRAQLLNETADFAHRAWPEQVSTQHAPLELVDVRHYVPRLQVLQAPRWTVPQQRFHVRLELAIRLARAARRLPEGYALGFWEGYRSLGVQRGLWETGLGLLREHYPEHEESALETLLDTFIARPDASAPHTLGQAVDVALTDARGEVLEAPSDLGLLRDVLESAGLNNYDPEWWHWSYDEPRLEFFQ